MHFRGVPVDFETFPRSIRRKFTVEKPFSSYPLISGDTFRALCCRELSSNDYGSLFQEDGPRYTGCRIFADAMPSSNKVFEFAKSLKSQKVPLYAGAELLIHNGDQVPNDDEFEILARHFKKIYSVNYVGNIQNVIPIPIGLENKKVLRNGVPRDYLREATREKRKEIDFLFAFSVDTNRVERMKALSLANELTNSLVVTRALSPKAYRNLVMQSKFVVSPPGNGLECHRTWESLYLGSTPIVKRDSWPFTSMRLPVIVVNDWQDLKLIKPNTDFNLHGFPWSSINAWLER